MKTISLREGWLFGKLPDSAPEDVSPAKLPDSALFETVSLPHTWFSEDDQYRGLTVYTKTLVWDEGVRRGYLSFEGAEQRCRVYADGELKCEHRGAYSRFRVELARPESGVTELVVLLDNRLDESIPPCFGDFTIFGGLYRPVNFLAVGDCSFDYAYYGTDGLIVRASLDDNGDGVLSLEPHVVGADESVRVRYTVGADIEAVGAPDETLTLRVPAPALWDGKAAANLYTVRAALCRGEAVLDETEIRTGFRTLSLSPDEGLKLNGRKYSLHGVAKHQDIGLAFNAVSDEQIRADFDLIGEIGASAVRLSHYQHAQTAYDEADARGLLVWAEIPMLKMTEDDVLFANTREQLYELILQNIHHPSVFCWGIQNEIAMFRDAPFMHERCTALHEIVKALDPGRFSACANLYPLKPKSRLNHITELVGYNIYFGWYYGKMEDYTSYLDRFHAAAPDVCFGISEYGVDSNIALHSAAPHVKDYTEEYQALWHETVYPQIEAKSWLWGSFIWNMFDFSSARRNEGGIRFVNGKGLVTRDRSVKKDAFYYYKARWSGEPFVHLCGHRFRKRCAETVEVKVYTNLPEVSLTVNGAFYALGQNNGNGTVLFADVPLLPGENRLEVRAEALCDALVFERVETPEASYALPDAGGGVVKNWFLNDDDGSREGYFSINDTASDILDSAEARAVLQQYVPGLLRVLDSGVTPLGLSLKSILGYGDRPTPNETVQAINKALNQIENLF